jgi:hypothetical protein
MHLEGPWLSTTGKRKGKQKFRNAEEARKARELAESWQDLQKKWGIEAETKKRNRAMKAPILKVSKPTHRGADAPKIPSLPFTAGPCTKVESKMYTGSKVKGIGTMHKSNAVPIFSDEEAVEISKMRR